MVKSQNFRSLLIVQLKGNTHNVKALLERQVNRPQEASHAPNTGCHLLDVGFRQCLPPYLEPWNARQEAQLAAQMAKVHL